MRFTHRQGVRANRTPSKEAIEFLIRNWIDNETELAQTCEGGNPEPYRRLAELVEADDFSPAILPANLKESYDLIVEEALESPWLQEAA
jgi:hypothetical protein